MAASSLSLKKVVNIMTPVEETQTESNTPENRSSPTTSSSRSYSPPRRPLQNDDILFPEPTFSEKFLRYLMVGIYLGGLSGLGFVLSIYYIFFWDSRMPPVYKPAKKATTTLFMKP
ncbi:uncharacterized protein LOC133334805 [Musca vetustissima]|uniref:uncharacterized protein LOC133334805 n=1 Tax=Musca vetustissima TaxID=27455 RepID=UPI002AB79D20|nr:uncharacterized protein LOC133334805 [Musca vetustissima]